MKKGGYTGLLPFISTLETQGDLPNVVQKPENTHTVYTYLWKKMNLLFSTSDQKYIKAVFITDSDFPKFVFYTFLHD